MPNGKQQTIIIRYVAAGSEHITRSEDQPFARIPIKNSIKDRNAHAYE